MKAFVTFILNAISVAAIGLLLMIDDFNSFFNFIVLVGCVVLTVWGSQYAVKKINKGEWF